MISIHALRTVRTQTRRRGSDMTNALLWAAFAIVVLISILGMYQVVQLNSNKTTATRTVSMGSSEARTLFRNAGTFDGLNNEMLIEAGAFPPETLSGTDVVLPYGSSVEFLPGQYDNTTFDGIFRFNGTRGAVSLCTFLTSGERDVQISGPLGSDYILPTQINCLAPNAEVYVQYRR